MFNFQQKRKEIAKDDLSGSMAEFYNYHPQFGAAFNDIIETQYGFKGQEIKDPTRYYFFYIRLMGLIKSLKWNGRVLDIGCGMGILAQMVHEKVDIYVGMDISIERIKQSRDRVSRPNCFFVVADAEHLPFKDSSFQKAAALEVIEHLLHTDLFLNEVNRVLGSGGDFVLSTPSAVFFEDNRHQLGREQHLFEFSPSKLRALLTKSFFHVKAVIGVGFKSPKLVIPVWLGSDIIKFLYKKIRHCELHKGYGNPISLQFDIVSHPFFNALYFSAGKKKFWERLMGLFGWFGRLVPALSSTTVVTCRKNKSVR